LHATLPKQIAPLREIPVAALLYREQRRWGRTIVVLDGGFCYFLDVAQVRPATPAHSHSGSPTPPKSIGSQDCPKECYVE